MIHERDEEYIKAFGDNLRKLRLERHMSQEALGLEAGLGKNQVYLIENGKINVSLSTLKRLAVALKVEPVCLLQF